jgi:drug/metabolite transporter (DMT)-like permease
VASLSPRLKADLALLAVAAVWGATFVMVKDALALVGPFTFLALRFTLSALSLAPITLARRGRFEAGWWLAGGAVGVVLFAGYGFQTAGLQYTSPARAGFITGLSVVIVAALGAALARRMPRWPLTLGVGLATSGLALLSFGDSLAWHAVGGAPASEQEPGMALLGDALVLGCAISFALHIVVLGRLAPKRDALGLTMGQIGMAAALSALAAGLTERSHPAALPGVLPAAVFTGAFATVAAFFIQTRAQRFTTATHTALIFSTEPVFAAVFAYLLAGEVLGPWALAGCGLILGGMVLSQLEAES